ncbi:MAG TPA: hypothetical protein VMV01_12825, partial [Planctomycetota bacterium]|nr:hypothetical protein [Planctomycetota bacterium]
MHEPRLSRGGAEAWLVFHPPYESFEIRRWQHQIQIQLADVLEIVRRDARVAGVERFDDAGAHPTMATVSSADQPDVRQPGGV